MENFLFDLYGTLVDVHTDENSPGFVKRYTKYFSRLNPKADFWQCYKSACTDPDDEYFEPDLLRAFKAAAPDADEREIAEAAYTFRKYSRSRLRLYRGAKTLLKGLKAQGKKVFLVSNAQACFTVPELKKLKIYDLFDGIELSSDFGKKKPCREFFLHAIEKYGLDTENSIYCGNDYKADIKGAKSANLSAAYIKSNISPAEDDIEKVKEVADFATSDYKSFINYLLNM